MTSEQVSSTSATLTTVVSTLVTNGVHSYVESWDKTITYADPAPLIQEYATFQSQTTPGKWKKRFCVIFRNTIMYFKSRTSSKWFGKGNGNFLVLVDNQTVMKENIIAKDAFILSISSKAQSHQPVLFRFDSQHKIAAWSKAIAAVIRSDSIDSMTSADEKHRDQLSMLGRKVKENCCTMQDVISCLLSFRSDPTAFKVASLHLRSMCKKSMEDLFFYLPQILQLIRLKFDQNLVNIELEKILLDQCSPSNCFGLRFSLALFWGLRTQIQGNTEISIYFQRMLLALEKIWYGLNRGASPTDTTLDKKNLDASVMQPRLNSYTTFHTLLKRRGCSLNVEEADAIKCFVGNSRDVYSDSFAKERRFVHNLILASEELRLADKKVRQEQLPKLLGAINIDNDTELSFIGNGVCSPTILRICEDESKPFSTKERCPYLLVLEVQDKICTAQLQAQECMTSCGETIEVEKLQSPQLSDLTKSDDREDRSTEHHNLSLQIPKLMSSKFSMHEQDSSFLKSLPMQERIFRRASYIAYGKLIKQSTTKSSKWQQRFCRLHGPTNTLMYFSSPSSYYAKSRLLITTESKIQANPSKSKLGGFFRVYGFRPKSKELTHLTFRTDSQGEFDYWINALEFVIQRLKVFHRQDADQLQSVSNALWEAQNSTSENSFYLHRMTRRSTWTEAEGTEIESMPCSGKEEAEPAKEDLISISDIRIKDMRARHSRRYQPMGLLETFGELWEHKQDRIREKSDRSGKDGWRLGSVFVKSFDDLRQEVFVMQLLKLIDGIFSESSFPLKLETYKILATGPDSGVIETLLDAISLDGLKKKKGFVSLRKYFETAFGPVESESFRKAQLMYLSSLVSYSLVTYLLGVKDRHNGNIMLGVQGNIIHIDFGFVFGQAPGGNFSLERPPFKLTKEMIDVLDGMHSDLFYLFEGLLVTGFLVLRENADTLISLVEMTMCDSNFPCFAGLGHAPLEAFKSRLRLGLSDDEAMDYARYLIAASHGSAWTHQYDLYQNASNGIAV